ncbi:bifunctional [glutamine synthetase] adenylyltransferase/[glutamine synthetase]-adenylyl-L-tyrosine phosphorylase [Maricaulis salignorans]|uniref:bifunctional [glutamine synthetase] adenylyltransferase/[glutamine synthetase]-adenylyl-L-tyrosine phosphorylase n=1 Tax=Maricaulis salignorans TaxID=144026 RepID=UPI003A958C03
MSDALPLLHCDLAPLPGSSPGQCDHVFASLPADVQAATATVRPFLDSVFAAAPYLGRLAQRRPEGLAACTQQDAAIRLDKAIADVIAAGAESPDIASLDTALRRAKADMHLLVALADLAGRWDVADVTAAVSRFADAAVQAALLGHVRFAAAAGRALPVEDAANPLPGLFVFALGKMGTGELNYSSDIDLVALFDADALRMPADQEPRQRLPRLLQAIVRTLQDVTAEGYVFRTDLRLRPDPGSTPVVLSTDAALNYYESFGQTWERAAWIKARYCAGDADAAQAYLDQMQPFIWRRALDFAAVEDIRGLARQIQTVGRRGEIMPAGHDLKLGRGGIREIEFFAQVPQLVFGGRDASVRVSATLKALAALEARGVVDAATLQSLSEDYRSLRAWEHRIQMRQDEPSQTLPLRDADRRHVAAMAGYGDLAAFDAAVEALLRRVHGHFSDQFEDDASLSSQAGTLILTGVEPTPDTLATLDTLGFQQSDQVWKRLNGWAGGKVRAARSPRARTLLAQIAPRLVDIMAATGEPDAAFVRFAAFFENLPMGVQPLSLLMNEPGLAADLISILTIAPRMAADLARRPDMLDVMLDNRFSVPLVQDPPDDFRTRLGAMLSACDTYEAALNAARRLVREERFRVGTQIVRGTADAQTAGAAYSSIADAAVEFMAQAAERETARRSGDMPGRYAVLGLGKLGGRELSADSDLDLMIVYDGDETAQTWFSRFAQRLISALSAPTEEGDLYEVDMQLRPSGKAGPVAVRLARFGQYYFDEAWTWELMALTRARVIAGDGGVNDDLIAAIEAALTRVRPREQVLADAREMRQRLEGARPAQTEWDIKSRVGGLQDIEFIVQTLQLVTAPEGQVIHHSTAAALAALARSGVIAADDAAFLAETVHLYLGMAQLLRATHGTGFDPAGASAGFTRSLVAMARVEDMDGLRAALDARCLQVRALFERYLELH